MIGIICEYYPDKKFGLIESRMPANNGWRVEVYFFGSRDLAFLACEPEVGRYVRFTPSQRRPKKAGQYPFANNVEVYETETVLQLAEIAEAVKQ